MPLNIESSQIYARRYHVLSIIIVFFCEILLMTGCGNDTQENNIADKENKIETEQEEQMLHAREEDLLNTVDEEKMAVEPTYDEMLAKFNEKFFAGLSNEDIEARVNDRSSYYQTSGYYAEIIGYWEEVREVCDIANVTEPLYFTDMKYYTESDFQDLPVAVIHLAKNEIYAKRGYIFNNKDLYHYFMGCAWYQPTASSENFDDAVFNDYEVKNLNLLLKLSTRAL